MTTPSRARSCPPQAGDDQLELAGLRAPPHVNVPLRTAGSDVRQGGVVLERSLAESIGLDVGDTIRLAGAAGPIELDVVGSAISPSQPRYPLRRPGLAWVTRATLAQIAPDRDAALGVMDVKLALLGARVRLGDMIDHRLRGHSLAQQAHPAKTPERVRQRLRGQRTDAAFAMRQIAPTAKNLLATAMPKAPLGSRAMMDHVMRAMR